jgi:hypothetical protein
LGIPEVCSIIHLDWPINIWLILKKDLIFLLCVSWRRQRALVIDNTETACQIVGRGKYQLSLDI